jgi:hypothetical protein
MQSSGLRRREGISETLATKYKVQALPGLRTTRYTQIRPYANCSITHKITFSRCKWNIIVVNISFLRLEWIFVRSITFSIYHFFLKSANTHTHTRTYVYYSNISTYAKFGLHKTVWNGTTAWPGERLQHDVTTQKSTTDIFIEVETSNPLQLTKYFPIYLQTICIVTEYD